MVRSASAWGKRSPWPLGSAVSLEPWGQHVLCSFRKKLCNYWFIGVWPHCKDECFRPTTWSETGSEYAGLSNFWQVEIYVSVSWQPRHSRKIKLAGLNPKMARKKTYIQGWISTAWSDEQTLAINNFHYNGGGGGFLPPEDHWFTELVGRGAAYGTRSWAELSGHSVPARWAAKWVETCRWADQMLNIQCKRLKGQCK
jgi:hypothetical protein